MLLGFSPPEARRRHEAGSSHAFDEVSAIDSHGKPPRLVCERSLLARWTSIRHRSPAANHQEQPQHQRGVPILARLARRSRSGNPCTLPAFSVSCRGTRITSYPTRGVRSRSHAALRGCHPDTPLETSGCKEACAPISTSGTMTFDLSSGWAPFSCGSGLPLMLAQPKLRKLLNRREKDWSGREDLNLRPPGPEFVRAKLLFSKTDSDASHCS